MFGLVDSEETEEKAWTFDLDAYYTKKEIEQYDNGNSITYV